MPPMFNLDVMLGLLAVGLALALRPWRALVRSSPPWPALAWWAVLPLMWSLDAITGMPVLQPCCSCWVGRWPC